MILSAASNPRVAQSVVANNTGLNEERSTSCRPTILVATAEAGIRASMTQLLCDYGVDILWASGMKEIKNALTKRGVAACFCGFWLVDGTYRDVVRHVRGQRTEIPVVVVCGPTCPQEYTDYFAALNIRAFDYICHPYQRTDLDRILNSTVRLPDAA